MIEKKKILIVSDCVCYPADEGNRRRIFNIINGMQTLGHTVDFLYFGPDRAISEKQMKDFLGKDHYFFLRIPKEKNGFFYKHSNGYFFERFVPQNKVDVKYLPEVNRKVQALLKKHKHDVLWLEYPYQSKVLEKTSDSVTKVIDTHDKFAYRNFKAFPYVKKVVDYSLTFLGERKALGRANYVIAIQKEEKAYYTRLLMGKKTKVITIGDNHGLVKNGLSKNQDICFVGSGNRFNVDGINWFINSIFPVILKKVRDCRLVIVGKICKEISVKPNKNIELLGIVDDIEEVYRNCRLVINPVRTGTGLNIKAIEAIAHCKPLVSTVAGARGLKYEKPVVAVAEDEHSFANQVIEFLESDSLCEQHIKTCNHFIKSYNQNNLKAMNRVIYSEE